MSPLGGSPSWRRHDRKPASSSGAGRRRRATSPYLRAGRRSMFPLGTRDDSLTLNASLVVASFGQNGLQSAAGTFSPSLTSTNNFINFCDTVSNLPITNGKQISSGSCNPAPMGEIPPATNQPSVRISSPTNGQTVAANTTFALALFGNNLNAAFLVNSAENYLSAPQQLGAAKNVLGHYQVVIEELDANSTAPMDSQDFTYFSIISAASTGGLITSSVTNGLPEGYYRITATAHAANYQPVLAPQPQHGSFDDVAYITITADGSSGSKPNVRRRTPISRPKRFTQRSSFPRDDAEAQSSLTLLSSVVASGFANDGQDSIEAGESASLTSTNNYINFCSSSAMPLIDGTGQASGFCNPAPIGILPSSDLMPTSRITYPRNGDIISPNAPMLVGVAISNLAVVTLTNVDTTYMSAPQTLDTTGLIQGAPYMVIEPLSAADQTPTDPQKFAMFKGFDGVSPDSTGVLTTEVPSGLPAGFYRLSVGIQTTNGQAVMMPVIQHGGVGDAIYFTVENGGALPTNQTAIVGSTLSSKSQPASVVSTGNATQPTPTSSPPVNTPTALPSQSSNNVALAVGAALGGMALLALSILGIWLFKRRYRKKSDRAEMLHWRHGGFGAEEFGPPPPTPFIGGLPPARHSESDEDTNEAMSHVVHIGSPPTAFRASKMQRDRDSAAVGVKRYASSSASVAPSYRTEAILSL